MLSVAFTVIGLALGYKIGFLYGFRCGRDDQVVLARIIEKERFEARQGQGSQARDPWD